MILQSQAKRFEMRIALAEPLDVRDRDIPFPAEMEVQVTDGDRGRAANARGAVEIDGVAGGEEFVESVDARAELGAKLRLLLEHGDAAKFDAAGAVVGFERLEIQEDGGHIGVRVDIEDGGDAQFVAEAFDIGDGAGMRADKKAGKDLRVS